MRNISYNDFFSELADYEKKGIGLKMDDDPASPMQIVNAYSTREDMEWMRDYVLDEKGDIESVCFNHIDPSGDNSGCKYPSN